MKTLDETATRPFLFPSKGVQQDPAISQVGGKGWSLIRMAKEGLPVPPGAVLPVEFFRPWVDRIKSSSEWSAFLAAANDEKSNNLQTLSQAVKDQALAAQFTDEQESLLSSALAHFGTTEKLFFAVRSSSPEEDLEGSSFAGGYETILGVTPALMRDAVKRAFASCLDHRVVVYKRQNGFDVTDPKIAVVIQQQIASEVAGVGFSLNPVTNNFDEAVFNANWGLGETVVAGIATPDTFVVDRAAKKVKRKELGGKEVSIWLKDSGSTEERQDPRHAELTLNDQQILALAEMIEVVEKAYGKPIDIEWAFSNGTLYLLQARPITTYVPLLPEMMTQPGAPKYLYIDFTISTQGLEKPLSPMGTSIIRRIQRHIANFLGIPAARGCADAVAWIHGGRLFLNLSHLFNIAGRDKFAHVIQNMDPLAARTLLELNENDYKASHTEKHFPVNALWELPEVTIHVLEARVLPEQARRRLQANIDAFFVEVSRIKAKNVPLKQYFDELLDCLINRVLKNALPMIITSRTALQRMKGILEHIEHIDEADLQRLERGLPNNVTTQMGLGLYHLSQLLPEGIKDESDFMSRLKSRTLPHTFLEEWDKFINEYGHRGFSEIDIASIRYREDPGILIEQILMLRKSATAQDNPQARFDQAESERHEARDRFCEQLHRHGWLNIKRFQGLFRVVEELAGYRETHKFCLVYVVDLMRQRLMALADELVLQGRLDCPNQIFDLNFEDVLELDTKDQARALDLRESGRRNREFPDRLARVPHLPAIFDSRGLILRPTPPPAKEGEVTGTAISPGVVRGRIKVLHTYDEKPLERGEILVARATDPGWTPLFVNAAAVILEIGGMLQHGALVAREYGLPCVSGVANATSLWSDGTLVEVDGSAGIVRTITE